MHVLSFGRIVGVLFATIAVLSASGIWKKIGTRIVILDNISIND